MGVFKGKTLFLLEIVTIAEDVEVWRNGPGKGYGMEVGSPWKRALYLQIAHLGKGDICVLRVFSLNPNYNSGERRHIYKEGRNLRASEIDQEPSHYHFEGVTQGPGLGEFCVFYNIAPFRFILTLSLFLLWECLSDSFYICII